MKFDWDIPLLDGYRWRWLENRARRPSTRTFAGCDTPELYRILETKPFDAFLIFGWNHKSNMQAMLACWKNRIPILMRGDSQLTTQRARMKLVLKYLPYRLILPRLNAHLYVGERNRNYLRHYAVPEDRLFFCPHFIDNERFARTIEETSQPGEFFDIRARLGIPDQAFVLLYVGKLISRKRPEDFLQVCQALLASTSNEVNLHAVLVGDGPLRKSLEDRARSFSDKVHFVGFCNQSQIPAFYRASDVLVVTSNTEETWGLVVNEAAACGIPAVVSDGCGCAPDMIESGRTGFTYPVGDKDALKARILDMVTLNAKRSQVIRKALAEKVKVFSMENATAGVTNALQSILRRDARQNWRHSSNLDR